MPGDRAQKPSTSDERVELRGVHRAFCGGAGVHGFDLAVKGREIHAHRSLSRPASRPLARLTA